jgi:hypothetical protein
MSNKARKVSHLIIAVLVLMVVLAACTNDQQAPQLPKPHKAYNAIAQAFGAYLYCEYGDSEVCNGDYKAPLYEYTTRQQRAVMLNVIHAPHLVECMATNVVNGDRLAECYDY